MLEGPGALKEVVRSSPSSSAVTNPAGIHEDSGSIPGLTQWFKDPVLLWLWCRLAVATLIRPLAWKLPYAEDVALKRPKKKKKERERDGKISLGAWRRLDKGVGIVCGGEGYHMLCPLMSPGPPGRRPPFPP